MRITKIVGTAALATIVSLAAVRADDDTLEEDSGDGKRSFSQICAENGFQYEEHQVITDDGYILTVFRIPGLNNEPTSPDPKPAVLMQHGILDSAYCFIVNWADVAPAFVAARAGYDVWLGNSRGNTYSKAHTTLDPKKNEKEFWSFDWEQMGQYDLPAVIDHILDKTSQEKLAYIGHSQGTTQMYYGLSENYQYFADKVNLFVALGPVTKVAYEQSNIIGYASKFYNELDDAFSLFGIHELLGANWFTSTAASLFCNHIPKFCELIEHMMVSHDIEADDQERFQVYMDHEPNGTSVQSLMLYAQNMREDRFQVWAPDYNTWFGIGQHRHTDLIPLNTIGTDIPIAMFVGKADTLADAVDAEWTREQIGDAVIKFQLIEGGHLSFLIGKDMSYFTDDVMDLLATYHPLHQAEFLQ